MPSTPFALSIRDLDFTPTANAPIALQIPKLDIGALGITCIMGANGAGKTLLGRVMQGIYTHNGHITLYGDDHVRAENSIGTVAQKPALLRRTVEKNIDFVLKHKTSLAKQARLAKTQHWLEHVALDHLAHKNARLLSGGEQQRLAIARALALEPRILICDECTANLDPSATARIEAILLELSRNGTKIIFITHDFLQAKRLADDVILMQKGQIVEHSPASRFFTQPKTESGRAWLAGDIL